MSSFKKRKEIFAKCFKNVEKKQENYEC